LNIFKTREETKEGKSIKAVEMPGQFDFGLSAFEYRLFKLK